MHLVSQDGQIRAVGVEDGQKDFTERLFNYGAEIVKRFDNLSGYVFKSRSPSCGLKTTPIYKLTGGFALEKEPGSGIFAATIVKLSPSLPVSDELGLMDPGARRDFIEAVKQYNLNRS